MGGRAVDTVDVAKDVATLVVAVPNEVAGIDEGNEN